MVMSPPVDVIVELADTVVLTVGLSVALTWTTATATTMPIVNALPVATAAVVTLDWARMSPVAVTVPPSLVVTVGLVSAVMVGPVTAPRIAPPTARPDAFELVLTLPCTVRLAAVESVPSKYVVTLPEAVAVATTVPMPTAPATPNDSPFV